MKNLRNSFWQRWMFFVSAHIGGTIAYLPFYMYGGGLLWVGLILIKPPFAFTFWQCFGVAIVFRTIRAWVYHRGDSASERILKRRIANDAWNAALEMLGVTETSHKYESKFKEYYDDYRKELEKAE